MNPKSPTWLTSTSESHSPFRQSTRLHLLKRAERDPRVIELVARLQEKGEEGTMERDLAERLCREGSKFMQELHKKFAPGDEDDILRLAAYMGEHTYADFFVKYLNAPKETHAEYAEIIQRLAPVLADLQPSVAIGFAPDILSVYTAAGKKAEAEQLFLTIAQHYPEEVMGNFMRLECFDNKHELISIAQAGVDANALLSPEKAQFAQRVKAQREVIARREGLS